MRAVSVAAPGKRRPLSDRRSATCWSPRVTKLEATRRWWPPSCGARHRGMN